MNRFGKRVTSVLAAMLACVTVMAFAKPQSPDGKDVIEHNKCCVRGFGTGLPDNSVCQWTCHAINQCPNSVANEGWIAANCASAPTYKCAINYGGSTVVVMRFSCTRPAGSNCWMPGMVPGYSCVYTQIGNVSITAIQCTYDAGDEC